jgi:hypothetical protein
LTFGLLVGVSVSIRRANFKLFSISETNPIGKNKTVKKMGLGFGCNALVNGSWK